MNWYKKAQKEKTIKYLGSHNLFGAHVAKFKIDSQEYAYKFSFPEQIKTLEQIAKHSLWKALNWAKENAKEELKLD